MSVIVNIAIPLRLEVIAAINNGADINSPQTADELQKASFPAISKAIKALPFNVTPKTESTLVDVKDDNDNILPDQILSDTRAWSGWGSKSVHCVTPSSTVDGYDPSGICNYWCLYARSDKSNCYYVGSKFVGDHVKDFNGDILITEEIGWYADVFVATIKTAILKHEGLQALCDKVSLESRGHALDDDQDLYSYGYDEGDALKLELRMQNFKNSGVEAQFDIVHKRDILRVYYVDKFFEQTGKEACILLPRKLSKMTVAEVKSIIAKKYGHHISRLSLFASFLDAKVKPLYGMKDHELLSDHKDFDGKRIWAYYPGQTSANHGLHSPYDVW